MKLHGVSLFLVEFEDALWLVALIGDLAVCRIMAEEDIVFLREGEGLFVEGVVGNRSRGGCWGS